MDQKEDLNVDSFTFGLSPNNSDRGYGKTITNTSDSDLDGYRVKTSTECSNYCDYTDEKWIKSIFEFISPKPYEWLFVVLFIVVFIFGLVGNCLVCFAVWKNNHLKTVTNYFLVNLAIADFSVILICLPPTFIHDIMESWFLGLAMCKIVVYLQKVSILVSVLSLTAISVERYLAICHPLTFIETKFKTRLAIIIIWFISLTTAIPDLVFMTLYPDTVIPDSIRPLLTSCIPYDAKKEVIYQLFLTVAFYFLPCIIMGFAYIKIAICLWASTTAGPASTDTPSNSQASCLRSRRRTAKMLIVVVIGFIVCYLPVYLLNILRYIGVLENSSDRDTVVAVAMLSHWLCYFNSAINPVIYNFMSGKFRKEFMDSCLCWRKCMPYCIKGEDSSESSTLTTKGSPYRQNYGNFGRTCNVTSRTEMSRLQNQCS